MKKKGQEERRNYVYERIGCKKVKSTQIKLEKKKETKLKKNKNKDIKQKKIKVQNEK